MNPPRTPPVLPGSTQTAKQQGLLGNVVQHSWWGTVPRSDPLDCRFLILARSGLLLVLRRTLKNQDLLSVTHTHTNTHADTQQEDSDDSPVISLPQGSCAEYMSSSSSPEEPEYQGQRSSQVSDLVLHQCSDLLEPVGQLHLLTRAVLIQRHNDLTAGRDRLSNVNNTIISLM